ncbi:GMC family oxidoreductase [Streptomyces klenkii]|uniref:GMC family oxidoreductase n=1 Tax=Streptomyces klenkii TaxID=1420899 RepID=A0A3B0AZR4_9ACTN|nr:GMC family oxidoreductase [Streptomyces klenkii]
MDHMHGPHTWPHARTRRTRWSTTVPTADPSPHFPDPHLPERQWHAPVPDTGDTGDPHSRVVIAGGGLAGLEVARQLAALGVEDVLVIEAGPAQDLLHIHSAHKPDQALRTFLDPAGDPHFHRPWIPESAPHYAANAGLRKRLGGRSLYWYGASLPVENWALADWPESIVKDLRGSWRGGGPLYEQVAADLGVDPNRLDRQQPVLELGGFRLVRTPQAETRFGDDGRWYAYSPLDHWRDPVTGAALDGPRGIRFLCGTEVLSVDIKDGRARGVLVRETGPNAEPRRISADSVVLAAGTIESSRLAIQALCAVDPGRPPRLDGLTDHIVQGFFLRVRDAGDAGDGGDSGDGGGGDAGGGSASHGLSGIASGSYVAACEDVVRSNLFITVERPEPGVLLFDVRLTGEQLPGTGSRVTCEPGGAYPWRTTVTANLAPADRDVVGRQHRVLEEVWRRLAAEFGLTATPLAFDDFDHPVRTNAFVLPESIGAEASEGPFTWSSLLGTEDHEGCTLPLGEVLDDRHAFAAVPGLYACGPATFPRMGAANPSLTTLALARRLAHFLAETEAAAETAAETDDRKPHRGTSEAQA